ncbi:MAG: TetR/AcrR family transcriptional regulator [Acidimicrobiales bacterium]
MTESELEVEEPAAGEPAMSRREQAVARSLFTARARAENRLQRFLDAALELMNEGESGRDFTVHEVVERSGQSLRLFYQYFGGKHELLLALFEESVRSTAEFLRQKIDEESDPLERIHRFVVEYYGLCRPPLPGAPVEPLSTAWVMVDFAQQLLTSHPTEAALAFDPLVSLFGEVLEDAETAGCIRSGLRHSPIAGMVLEAIMFNAFSTTIGGTSVRTVDPDPAEELWEFILHGVGSGVPHPVVEPR